MAAATGSTSPVPSRAIEAIDRNDLPPSLPRRLDPWRETNKFMTTASTIVGIRVRELVSTSTDEFTSAMFYCSCKARRRATPHRTSGCSLHLLAGSRTNRHSLIPRCPMPIPGYYVLLSSLSLAADPSGYTLDCLSVTQATTFQSRCLRA